MNRALAGGILAAVLVGGAVFAWRWMNAGEGVDKPAGDTKVAEPGVITDEEERAAYVRQFVTIEDLRVAADQKPDDAGPVPGLLRVSGTAKNNGDKTIMAVRLAVHPQDAAGNVIASYREEVLGNRKLGPGESRAFKYTIPESRDFAGQFQHNAE